MASSTAASNLLTEGGLSRNHNSKLYHSRATARIGVSNQGVIGNGRLGLNNPLDYGDCWIMSQSRRGSWSGEISMRGYRVDVMVMVIQVSFVFR